MPVTLDDFIRNTGGGEVTPDRMAMYEKFRGIAGDDSDAAFFAGKDIGDDRLTIWTHTGEIGGGPVVICEVNSGIRNAEKWQERIIRALNNDSGAGA